MTCDPTPCAPNTRRGLGAASPQWQSIEIPVADPAGCRGRAPCPGECRGDRRFPLPVVTVEMAPATGRRTTRHRRFRVRHTAHTGNLAAVTLHRLRLKRRRKPQTRMDAGFEWIITSKEKGGRIRNLWDKLPPLMLRRTAFGGSLVENQEVAC